MAQDNRRLANCNECGRLIPRHAGLELCTACFARQLEAYKRIERVLAETPDVSPSELSRQAQIGESVIRRLARKGRIKLKSAQGPFLCERCGKPMEEVGRFCAVCRADLMFEAKKAAAVLRARASDRANKAHGVVRALTRKRSIFRSVDYGTKGKYSP